MGARTGAPANMELANAKSSEHGKARQTRRASAHSHIADNFAQSDIDARLHNI